MKLKRPSTEKKTNPRGVRAVARAVVWIKQRLGRPARKAAPAQHRPGTASSFDPDEFRLVRRDLAAVLDRHPEARTVMRFVRALEHGLRKKGRHALNELPVEVVRRAMSQLDAVVVDWSPEGLRSLRSRAALSIAERERVASSRQVVRSLDFHGEVEIEEASVTTFMEVNEEWERSFTGRTGAVALEAPAEQVEVQPA